MNEREARRRGLKIVDSSTNHPRRVEITHTTEPALRRPLAAAAWLAAIWLAIRLAVGVGSILAILYVWLWK